MCCQSKAGNLIYISHNNLINFNHENIRDAVMPKKKSISLHPFAEIIIATFVIVDFLRRYKHVRARDRFDCHFLRMDLPFYN